MPATLAILVVLVSVIFDFLNGLNDSGNIVAAAVSTRALSPRRALLLASIAELIGPFLFGVAVANTIGRSLVDTSAISGTAVLAAMLAAVVWNTGAVALGIPSSSSHALVGGLVGAVAVTAGFGAIKWEGLIVVVLSLVLSPLVGFAAGFIALRVVNLLARRADTGINRWLRGGQVVATMALALSHGANDAQKSMGVITLMLVALGFLPEFQVPLWVIAVAAVSLALGMGIGGWRTMKTLGIKIYRIRPIHGFSAQVAASLVIMVAAIMGGPVSTTHVVSSAIVGAGSAQRASQVRWGIARYIMTAWILTIPAAGLLAALLAFGFESLHLVGGQ